MAFAPDSTVDAGFVHRMLPCGVEFAADPLSQRRTVAMSFRMLSGVSDEPAELNGVAAIVERTLSKGTQHFEGRALADAFDALGAQWGTGSGRQSMQVRVLCLPEFVDQVIDLVAEMLCRPTFPDDACRVAVDLAREHLQHMEDDPQELLRVMTQKLALGPVYGRHIGGEFETLARLSPELVRQHWRAAYHRGRLQVALAGPVDPDAVALHLDAAFATLGSPLPAGRQPADFEYQSRRAHREKDLKQQYIAMTLPGLAKDDPDFGVEQVLLGVLAGGMSGRLFTEVREKQGLVYWVGAWSEQLRGKGLIHIGASTTPQRCEQTFKTLLRELERIGEDLTLEETQRARHSLIAHALTEDDLTRAHAAGLSDDLFHFSRPIGLDAKLEKVRRVQVEDVAAYARRLPRDATCVATLGPVPLA
jgi:predicted Zn-dependent peptidase